MSKLPTFKVCHLIPYDGVGGVEVAARSLKQSSQANIQVSVEYLFSPPEGLRKKWKLFSPLHFASAASRLAKCNPDLVIVSLWRSCVVALIAKLLNSELKLVLFLHSAKNAHFVDRIVTQLTASLSMEVWADSVETSSQRLKGGTDRIISFVTSRRGSVTKNSFAPNFIFWGRLHKDKNLGRALEFFSEARKRFPEARFSIIGPDGGDQNTIRKRVSSTGLDTHVTLFGPATIHQIQSLAGSHSFFLQTSNVEGMAMAVVEAMQLGLIPIVRPVGEIKNYCKHGYNSLLIGDTNNSFSEILETLANSLLLEQIRENAIATWQNKPLYTDDVINACSKIAQSLSHFET